MTYEDMCEVFEEVRCHHNPTTIWYDGDLVSEVADIWYAGRRYFAEASRAEPVPARRRGTYVTEHGRTVWDETDKRIVSAPTIKQLVRKLTEEGEYHL